jgi:rSAM/selenodomain-associated transferase 1
MGVARWWRRRSGASPRDRAAQHVLIVLLKRPVAGEAKTRLIPALGAEDAAHLYRLLAEAVMRSTAPSHGEYARRLFAAPAGSVGEIERWFPGEICRPQAAGDLGTRLATAFDEAFASGAARAVIIGSDAPALGADDVRKALAALDHADVVLGAAEDGGYTLIALARPAPELFRDIAWSTPQVLAATRTRAEEAGLAVHVLAPPFRDIDTLDDVRAEWRTLLPIVARDPELLARIEPLVGRPGPPGT